MKKKLLIYGLILLMVSLPVLSFTGKLRDTISTLNVINATHITIQYSGTNISMLHVNSTNLYASYYYLNGIDLTLWMMARFVNNSWTNYTLDTEAQDWISTNKTDILATTNTNIGNNYTTLNNRDNAINTSTNIDNLFTDDLTVDADTFNSSKEMQTAINITGLWYNINVTGATDSYDLKCTDCIGTTEIADSYILNTGDTMDGNLVIIGNLTTIGDYIKANVTNMNLNGSFSPELNNLFDIGSPTLLWNDIYATTLYGSLGWKNLTDYPSACTSSQAITGIGDTITCSAISITESQISDLQSYALITNTQNWISGNITMVRGNIDTNISNIQTNGSLQLKLINSSNITCIGNQCFYNGSIGTGGGGSPFTNVDNIYIWNNTGTLTFNETKFNITSNRTIDSRVIATFVDNLFTDDLTVDADTFNSSADITAVVNVSNSYWGIRVADLLCADCLSGTEIAELADADISNTLTASDLVASSSVVADAEVDNDITIASTKPLNTTADFNVNQKFNVTASTGAIAIGGTLAFGLNPFTIGITSQIANLNASYAGLAYNTVGISGENITSGTVADARIASTITRDEEWNTQAEVESIWGVNLATDTEVTSTNTSMWTSVNNNFVKNTSNININSNNITTTGWIKAGNSNITSSQYICGTNCFRIYVDSGGNLIIQ